MGAFDDVASLPPQEIWAGVAARAVHGERVTLSVIELAADRLIPEHSHDNEQVGLLVVGSLTFRVADETRELRPGATWSIPATMPHEIRTGPDGAVVVEAFAPVRDDWLAVEREPSRPPRWPRSSGDDSPS